MVSLGVQLQFSSPFHPEGNSVVERLNRDLKQSLTARVIGRGSSWLTHLYGVQRALNNLPRWSLGGRTSYECLFGTQMFVPDLDGPGVEAAETPFDINDRVTVLQELQQFREDNSSESAASTGIKDVPVTSTGWIPRVGDLVHEKYAVKKEFGPSYRAPVPVLGIHGTRTVILPPLPKKIALFPSTMSSYNMWPILHSRPRGTSSSSRIPLTAGEDVPLQVIYTNTVASPSLGRVEDDLAIFPLMSNNLETFDRVTMTADVAGPKTPRRKRFLYEVYNEIWKLSQQEAAARLRQIDQENLKKALAVVDNGIHTLSDRIYTIDNIVSSATDIIRSDMSSLYLGQSQTRSIMQLGWTLQTLKAGRVPWQHIRAREIFFSFNLTRQKQLMAKKEATYVILNIEKLEQLPFTVAEIPSAEWLIHRVINLPISTLQFTYCLKHVPVGRYEKLGDSYIHEVHLSLTAAPPVIDADLLMFPMRAHSQTCTLQLRLLCEADYEIPFLEEVDINSFTGPAHDAALVDSEALEHTCSLLVFGVDFPVLSFAEVENLLLSMITV
ncbi:hypothetical protein NDU88_005415 [Pleurodeles waltl]|uniref:Integrase catalytic domain-containing protein n=1 Tax=Pleurodeles waltl TaxID=8319 RepID=A0AAV7TUP3_PLEWA|nr:hypothetical protein NDU88_005415 [Pleurodeles waltl]